jgi:hypothetical protein
MIITSYTTWYKRLIKREDHYVRERRPDEKDDEMPDEDASVPGKQRQKRRRQGNPSQRPTKKQKTSKDTASRVTARAEKRRDDDEDDERAYLPRIFDRKLDLSKYERVTSPADADFHLETLDFRLDVMSSWKFAQVLCDEVQQLKNKDSLSNRSTQLIDREGFVGMTGTLLYNRPEELVAYLRLLWCKMGSYHFDISVMNIGDRLGLFHPDYNAETGLSTTIDGDVVTTKGILPLLDDIDRDVAAAYRLALENGWRVWMVHPDLISAVGGDADWDSRVCFHMVRPVIRMIQVRWNRACKILLPDGSFKFPGAGLPPPEIVTEEVAQGGASYVRAAAITQRLLDSLMAPSPEGDVPTMSQVPISSPAKGPENADETKKRVNFATHREGLFTAFDLRFEKLLSDAAAQSIPASSGKVVSALRDALVSKKGLTKRQRERLSKHGEKDVVAGVEAVKQIVRDDLSGGYHTFYSQTMMDTDWVTPPILRGHLLDFALRFNPQLTRLFELILYWVFEQRKRLLVYVDTPMIQQLVLSILLYVGIITRSVRSIDAAKNRKSAIDDFSNLTTKVDILVANVNTLGAGVNLHHQCHVGALLNFLSSIEAMNQVFGRTIRFDQKELVKWHIIKVIGTYHDYQERSIMTKGVRLLMVSAELPQWLPLYLRELVAYELLKSTFGQPFNRYA